MNKNKNALLTTVSRPVSKPTVDVLLTVQYICVQKSVLFIISPRGQGLILFTIMSNVQ